MRVLRHTLLMFLMVVVFLGSLIVFAPAHFLGVLLGYWSEDSIVIANAQGSLWQGQGDLWVINEDIHEKVSSLSWNVFWKNIWKAEASIQLRTQTSNRVSEINWNGNTWHMSVFELPIPLQAIAQFLPKDIRTTWHDMKAGGTLMVSTLTAQGNVLNQTDQIPLKGTIFWEKASLITLPIQPIGSYRFELLHKNGQLSFKLGTLQGPLSIEGNGQVSAGQLEARFIMTPSVETYNVFKPILSFWGKPQDNRRFEIVLHNLTQ